MKNETGEPKFLQQSEDVWEQTKQNIEAIKYIIGSSKSFAEYPTIQRIITGT